MGCAFDTESKKSRILNFRFRVHYIDVQINNFTDSIPSRDTICLISEIIFLKNYRSWVRNISHLKFFVVELSRKIFW